MQTDDKVYETVVTYQLSYLIDTAEVCLNSIDNPKEKDIERFANTPQYYRFYVDHLFDCLGRIHDYFIKKTMTDRINLNRTNYGFSEAKYPLLCIKDYRNLIEHLDDRNEKEIDEFKGVGGFNVLSDEESSEMVETIERHKEWYPYLLDLRSNSVLIYNINKTEQSRYEVISLIQLREEIEKLKSSVESFKVFVK